MATLFMRSYLSGKTVAVTLQQANSSTGATVDLWWKESGSGSGAWVAGASATQAERRIALADSNGFGFYVGGKSAAFSTYTGHAYVYYYDTAITNPLDLARYYFKAGQGVELDKYVQDLIDGGATASISPWHVRPERTWVLEMDSATARNVVFLDPSAAVTCAMDFSKVLNEGTALASVTTVNAVTAAAITFGTPAISQDGTQAHFAISGLSGNSTYTVYVIVTTTDGDTLVGYGALQTTPGID